MRIALVIGTFGAGGAERVMASMANYWVRHGQDVSLITLSCQADDWFHVDHAVKRIGLNLVSMSFGIRQAITENVRRVLRLRRQLQALEVDIVISFLDTTNVLTLLACTGFNVPVVVSERIDPRYHVIGRGWDHLRSLLYRRAHAVVVQSVGVRDWARTLVSGQNVRIIPNPLSPPDLARQDSHAPRRDVRTIVGMGRLVPQKGFDLLIRAFAQCADQHPAWSLVLLGEGTERANLEALARHVGVERRIYFAGNVKAPSGVLRDADVFVLSSRYEGFPNALLEAMACGLAVISTDCPSGPREIIDDGCNGVLVPPGSADALAAAMDRLMRDADLRRRIGIQAIQVLERFSLDSVMGLWNKLVEDVSGRRLSPHECEHVVKEHGIGGPPIGVPMPMDQAIDVVQPPL